VSRLSGPCRILNISQPYRPPRPIAGTVLLTFCTRQDALMLRKILLFAVASRMPSCPCPALAVRCRLSSRGDGLWQIFQPDECNLCLWQCRGIFVAWNWIPSLRLRDLTISQTKLQTRTWMDANCMRSLPCGLLFALNGPLQLPLATGDWVQWNGWGNSLNNSVCWDVTPCGFYKNRHFGGKDHFRHQSERISELGTLAVTSNRIKLQAKACDTLAAFC
jgi:hypothetical protein